MAKIELPDPSAGVARRLRAPMVKVERGAHADAAVRVLSAAVLVIAAGCAKLAMPSAAASFDPAPWLQDFAQVEHHLGVAYANLEWNYAHRGLKLDRLASETRLQIRGASSNRPGIPGARAVHRGIPRSALDSGASTGSAAEWFAAVLQDNRAAMLVGEQTAGAGCGYTDGGIPLKLSRTGIAIAVPDCARYCPVRQRRPASRPLRSLRW